MIKFDKFQGVHLVSWLPCVIACRVPIPFDKILESSGLTMTSVVNDVLHFILLFAINQVRWWSGKVRSMCCDFSIW